MWYQATDGCEDSTRASSTWGLPGEPAFMRL